MHPEKESGSRRRQLLGFQIVRESSGSFLADSLFSDGTVGWIRGSFVFRCFSCGVCADFCSLNVSSVSVWFWKAF